MKNTPIPLNIFAVEAKYIRNELIYEREWQAIEDLGADSI